MLLLTKPTFDYIQGVDNNRRKWKASNFKVFNRFGSSMMHIYRNKKGFSV